jgi:two-component system sensor histidine kinase SenX3
VEAVPVALGAVLAVSTAVLAVVVVSLLRHRARRRHQLEALAELLPDPVPRPAGGAARDVVDRVERGITALIDDLEAGAEARSRLEWALQAIPQGVRIVDEQGEVVFRNHIAAGFESGRHSDALVAAAVEELIADALIGVHANRTLDLFGPPRRTLVISATPLFADHASVGALAVIDDVTEQRRVDAVRRDFVANISHELKTPVGAISLLAETLLAEDDAEISHRLTNRMVDEAIRVNRTIEDLLELSRIENEEAPRHEPVPVHLVLAEAVDRIRPAAEHAGIPVEVDEPDSRLAVLGDRRQLVSAVYNLLDNAVKYSDAGSPIQVRAGTDGRYVDLTVQDHGIGIPARDLERVFERFYRVDQARSRQTGGTGLGLAIVRHVVSNHDGEVRVESRLGEGTSFTLWLPSASGPIALPTPARAEAG